MLLREVQIIVSVDICVEISFAIASFGYALVFFKRRIHRRMESLRVVSIMTIGSKVLLMTPVTVDSRVELSDYVPVLDGSDSQSYLINEQVVLLFITTTVLQLLYIAYARCIVTVGVSDRDCRPAASNHIIVKVSAKSCRAVIVSTNPF